MCSFTPSFYRSSEHYTTKMLTAGHRGQSISRQEGKDSGSVKWGKQKQNTKNEHEFLYGVISTVFKHAQRSKTGSCAAVAWRGASLRRDRVPLWEVRFGTWTSTGSVPVHLAQSLGGAVARGSRGAAQSGSARGRRAYLLSRLQTASTVRGSEAGAGPGPRSPAPCGRASRRDGSGRGDRDGGRRIPAGQWQRGIPSLGDGGGPREGRGRDGGGTGEGRSGEKEGGRRRREGGWKGDSQPGTLTGSPGS